MGFKTWWKNQSARARSTLVFIQGAEVDEYGVQTAAASTWRLFEDRIEVGTFKPRIIQIHDIVAVDVKSETETQSGRLGLAKAAVGGLALGPAGAVVGMIHGTKQKTVNDYYLVVTVLAGDEPETLRLKAKKETVQLFASKLHAILVGK